MIKKQLREINVPFSTEVRPGLPHGARVLGAEIRDEELCIWIECNPENDVEPRVLRSYPIYGSFLSPHTQRFISIIDNNGLKYSLYEIIQ